MKKTKTGSYKKFKSKTDVRKLVENRGIKYNNNMRMSADRTHIIENGFGYYNPKTNTGGSRFVCYISDVIIN